MKVRKIIFSLFLFSGTLMYSQSFGIKGGVNISNLSKGYDFEDNKAKIGFHGGVFMNLPLTGQLSFQPEIIYNNVGSKVKYAVSDSEYEKKLNYISVPLMIQYNLVSNLQVEAGPQLGLLLNAKEKYTALNGDAITEKINKDFLNTFDFGVGIGAIYYFTSNLGVNIRYVAGFTDIYKYNEDKSVRNNNLQIGLHYKFK